MNTDMNGFMDNAKHESHPAIPDIDLITTNQLWDYSDRRGKLSSMRMKLREIEIRGCSIFRLNEMISLKIG